MNNLIAAEVGGEQSFNNLIQQQKKDGTYATTAFIRYSPVYLGIPIRILEIKNGSVQDYTFSPILSEESKKVRKESEKVRALCIALHNEHFQSVVEEETP